MFLFERVVKVGASTLPPILSGVVGTVVVLVRSACPLFPLTAAPFGARTICRQGVASHNVCNVKNVVTNKMKMRLVNYFLHIRR